MLTGNRKENKNSSREEIEGRCDLCSRTSFSSEEFSLHGTGEESSCGSSSSGLEEPNRNRKEKSVIRGDTKGGLLELVVRREEDGT